jgi:hypothetical protein
MFFVRDLARSASGRFVVHSSALARHWDNNLFRRVLTPTRSAPDGQAREKWNIERFKQCETGDHCGGQLVAKVPMDPYPTEAHVAGPSHLPAGGGDPGHLGNQNHRT